MDNFENKDEEKRENVTSGAGRKESPYDPNPVSSETEKKDEKKAESPKTEPKKEKKAQNPYEQYRFWGSEDGSKDTRGPKAGGKKPAGGPSPNPARKGPKGGKPNKVALIALGVLLVTFLVMIFTDTAGAGSSIETTYTEFMGLVGQGSIRSAKILDQTKVEFMTTTGQKGKCVIPYADPNLMNVLSAAGVNISGGSEPLPFWYILIQALPWVIFVFMMVMIFKQTSAATGGKMMGNLGKSHAQKFEKSEINITFKDVAGQKEAKRELEEVVDFLKHPDRYTKIGARIPKGVLLVGPPGTGKTLLAKAVAGEAGVNFFYTSGSDFVEMFVGMGAARVRELFETGRKNSPCIIFIDELDAVGRARGTGLGGGHDEREQTLNQMLVEMDGFSTDPGIIVIAATNRPDVLDPALLRPGRFDRQVTVELPDVQERLDVLRIHTKKVMLMTDVDLERIARATPGTSGADLANLVNEAALFAAREHREAVNMNDFEKARDKIILGVARESRYMTLEEKRATAYHEAGHTLLHYYLPTTDPLHKVTIVPHGQALGITMSLPEKDIYSRNKTSLEEMICVMMGGYAAEKIIYGETTTGTSNDNQRASQIAHKMVTEWGMSDLGFIYLASNNEDQPVFLGRDISQRKEVSDSTANAVDREVKKILDRCMDRTMDILTTHRDQLELLTEKLVEKETLDDKEIREMFGFPAVTHVTELQ